MKLVQPTFSLPQWDNISLPPSPLSFTLSNTYIFMHQPGSINYFKVKLYITCILLINIRRKLFGFLGWVEDFLHKSMQVSSIPFNVYALLLSHSILSIQRNNSRILQIPIYINKIYAHTPILCIYHIIMVRLKRTLKYI